MKALCFALFCLAITLASAYDTDEGVVVLNKKNFDQALGEFEYALVEFYAPWCGHCKRLAPEYSKAAEELASSNPEVKLCKVDAAEDSTLAERYDVSGFPTLKFFIKGNAEPIEYNGGRTAGDLVNWIKRKVGQVTVEVNSVQEAEDLISANEAVAFLFGSSSSNAYHIFASCASMADEVIFAHSNSDEVKQKYGASDDNLIIFANYGEEKSLHSGEHRVETLKELINTHRFATVMTFNQNSAQKIFGEGTTTVFLINGVNEEGKNAEEAFRAVAKELRHTLSFCSANIEEDLGGRLAEYLGVGEDDVPAIRIVEPQNNNRKYVLEKEATVENIKAFVNDFTGKTLKPFFKSEEIPTSEHEGDVRVVVGKNFDQIVLDNTKDVLLELYAPWCGHCQQLTPIYEALAARFKDSKDVVIAKMDATANEVESVNVEGFPTIRLYPKNNKQSPIEFNGERTEEAFVDFLKKHQGQATEGSSQSGSSSQGQAGSEQAQREPAQEQGKIKRDEL